MFVTDMPSEKATVLSKSSRISKKRNLLSLTLEPKVIRRLFYSRLLVLKAVLTVFLTGCVPVVPAGINGGFLLGVRSVNGLAFYDWENTELIRRIEIQPKHVRLTSFSYSGISVHTF